MAQRVSDTNQYRVSYKFPRTPVVNMNYTAPSLAALMKNLQQTEDVTSKNVEFLVIHQILTNGRILELVDIEEGGNRSIIKSPNVVDINSKSKALTIVGLKQDKEDDELLGYGDRGPEDERVLERVTALLTRASTSEHSKPHIKLKANAVPVRKIIRGFHFFAKPAHCEPMEV